jgi:hypothetical protein
MVTIIANLVILCNPYLVDKALYANFTKKDRVIHIEYGDEDCIFGESSKD